MSKNITENKIKINVLEDHDNPSKSSTFYNEKMKINRFLYKYYNIYIIDYVNQIK